LARSNAIIKRRNRLSQAMWSFTLATALRDFFVTERSQPETFADNVWFNLERVFRTGFEETQQVFDDSGGCVVSVKVDEPFAIDYGRIDECGFLSVVDEVTRVNT